jgi:hypothetical protein
MTDVLIRDVPEDDLKRIDEKAARLGLSRNEYLRRQIGQDAAREPSTVTRADFERLTDLGRDLLDDDVMRGAWS